MYIHQNIKLNAYAKEPISTESRLIHHSDDICLLSLGIVTVRGGEMLCVFVSDVYFIYLLVLVAVSFNFARISD